MGFDSKNNIVAYLHCAKCLKEKPPGVSPREWAQLEVGWTPEGIQVWCRRHECNVLHVDFVGNRHPAITTVAAPMKKSRAVE